MSEGEKIVRKRQHPGRGRGKGRAHPKGRQLDPTAQAEVASLLGDRPRNRDLLIEYLHLIQDSQGCLPAAHLAALADEMRIPMAEVYEVASFYAHFDIVREDEAKPPALTVRVCDSLTCEMMGAQT
ncbi:MAG: NAD(P)H-dependent oxidoreductase subunit E, partial [Rhodospirillaceae bacterium]|nr:NAD(P)H-dependent oxidoreductase subunit E [Rhodospirillaceae bacterium]